MKVSKFIGILFEIQETTHLAHLHTTSYAKHMALGALYEEIEDWRDKFAEAYAGKYEIIKNVPITKEPEGQDMISYLKNKAKEIESFEKELTDGFLQQIVQSILELIYTTLYKLRFLN